MSGSRAQAHPSAHPIRSSIENRNRLYTLLVNGARVVSLASLSLSLSSVKHICTHVFDLNVAHRVRQSFYDHPREEVST